MKKILTTTILAATCIFASTVYAEKVTFPVGQKNGSFNCVADDSSALVTIDTSSLNINGGCSGSQYVTSPGHLANIPADVLNKHYFEIQKSATKAADVEVNVSHGNVVCKLDHGDKTAVFGDGNYCLSLPK